MRAILHTENADFSNGKQDEQIISLTDRLKLNLDRIPCQGETLGLCIGDYILETTVQEVSTSWTEPRNRNFKKEAWGVTYDLWLDKIEVIQHLKNTTSPSDRKPQDFSSYPLSDPELGLRLRTVNPLRREDIVTVGDLCSRSEADLRKIRGIAGGTLKEIREFLREYGLTLKES